MRALTGARLRCCVATKYVQSDPLAAAAAAATSKEKARSSHRACRGSKIQWTYYISYEESEPGGRGPFCGSVNSRGRTIATLRAPDKIFKLWPQSRAALCGREKTAPESLVGFVARQSDSRSRHLSAGASRPIRPTAAVAIVTQRGRATALEAIGQRAGRDGTAQKCDAPPLNGPVALHAGRRAF